MFTPILILYFLFIFLIDLIHKIIYKSVLLDQNSTNGSAVKWSHDTGGDT